MNATTLVYLNTNSHMPGHFTFFTEHIEADRAVFDASEHRHAIIALRYKVGDAIDFTNGKGLVCKGFIDEVRKDSFSATVASQHQVEQKPGLRIACGIIKSSDRMEWMVEKCTECGVKTIYFVATQASERTRLNLDRLKKTGIAALKQSHGAWLPQLEEISWKSLLSMQTPEKYIAALGETPGIHLHNLKPISTTDRMVLIGPEGDFTAEEVQQAQAAGYSLLSLGALVLRTETAAMVIAAQHIV